MLLDLIPTLLTTMVNFSPVVLNSSHMLFLLSRMPFPLFLCLDKAVPAENEEGLATVILSSHPFLREGARNLLCY